MIPCADSNCNAAATRLPVLVLTPSASLGYAHRARARLAEVGLCDACAEGKTAEDFISNAGWEQITASFSRSRRAVPLREHTKLEWTAISP